MAQRPSTARRAAAPSPRAAQRRRRVTLTLLTVGVLVIAVVAVLLMLRTPPRRSVIGVFGPSPIATVATAPSTSTSAPTESVATPTVAPPTPVVLVATPTAVVIDRGGVITQIIDTLRLETEVFVGERLIESDRLDGTWKDTLYGERILLIASGKTSAGVDLQKVRKEDIIISSDGLSITLNLPPTEILVNTLDNQRTHRYSTQSGWLADNPDLETEARKQGELEILKAACEGEIMDKAMRRVQINMTGFLHMLDFERVTVNITAGPCSAPPPNPATTITPDS